ncbi:hypothetical protein M758_11G160300 [Ceratodon purpureus]|uniref:DNA 3'-5' helicase n=1 Tax=Ceratodon purpureus TaxID=3225 RepID=A0A8T0GJJ1_CERPU|nr:hypothetical protein KC19_11G164500 [Ceratodon purpureus]KAG0602099.1 hypothetical protein M758_11G160300 [Ceratodon purpureus]
MKLPPLPIARMASLVPSLRPPRPRPWLCCHCHCTSNSVPSLCAPGGLASCSSSPAVPSRFGATRPVRRTMLRALVQQGGHRLSDGKRTCSWLPTSLPWLYFGGSTSGSFICQIRPPVTSSVTFGTVVKSPRRRFLSQVCTSSEGQPMVVDDGKLLKAMVYEAQNGFSNVSGVASRFGEFLYAQLSLRSTAADNVFSSLENDARRYDRLDSVNRAQLLDRVAQAMGFLNTQDLISHHVALREASVDLQDPPRYSSEAPATKLKAKQVETSEGKVPVGTHSKSTAVPPSKSVHSAIKFGSSEPIQLYKPPVDGKGKKSTIESKYSAEHVKPSETIVSQPKAPNEKALLQMKRKLTKSPAAVTPTLDRRSLPSIDSVGNADAQIKVSEVDSYVEETSTELILTRGAANYKDCMLDIPLGFIKNLSVYQRSRLDENGFHTLRMLLQHFPRTYVNFQQAGQRVEDGQHLSFVGTIMSSRGLRLGPSLGAIEVIVRSKVDAQVPSDEHSDDSSSQQGRTVFLHLKKFFRGVRFTNPWFLNKMAAKYPLYAQVAVGGKVKALPLEDHFEIREYNLELWDHDANDPSSADGGEEMKPELEMSGRPYPVYPSKGGLQPKTLEFCIQRLLPALPVDLDPLPKDIREKHGFVGLRQAYLGIHTPQDAKDAEQARQRLVFDEFFYLQLGLLLQRQQISDKYLGDAGPSIMEDSGTLGMEQWSPLTLKLVNSLPYTLTNSQKKAASEIMWDLKRPVPMSRLLQGDVGCGKTVVAFLGLIEVIDAGYQGALMAPTEFLAIQHYQRIMAWLDILEDHERPRVALLTGSTPIAKARIIRSELESGEITLAIGTHSLISDSIRFANLGLAVVDEQHRFGVAQRGRLNSKVRDSGVMLSAESIEAIEGGRDNEREGASNVVLSAPHVLAMSATPIPRTLALAMHGDMSISQITELPPGRPKTTTLAFQGNNKGRQEVYTMMREELEAGGRVFVVYPVIGLSEELPELRAAESEFETLTEEFKDFQCGLVHGRMKAQEKEAAMELFKIGKSQILVSTTVIEVGIDIPEASMIVIEHAERYGMAQLHQLRGRVGRGSRDSKCILLGSTLASLNRLKLLENSNDGFYLAEIDLKLRGPGDMLGKRQSGFLPEFGIARLDQDGEVLERARAAAEEILCSHHGLKDLPRVKQELSIRRPPGSLG